LSFVIGAGCRYFDIPAASPPVIPGALIVLTMTLGYTSMDRPGGAKNVVAIGN
jgi:XapX domain-containing protein